MGAFYILLLKLQETFEAVYFENIYCKCSAGLKHIYWLLKVCNGICACVVLHWRMLLFIVLLWLVLKGTSSTSEGLHLLLKRLCSHVSLMEHRMNVNIVCHVFFLCCPVRDFISLIVTVSICTSNISVSSVIDFFGLLLFLHFRCKHANVALFCNYWINLLWINEVFIY